MSTGDLLRLAREANGMTQVDVERRSGVPQGHISRYERDRHEPREDTLERLAMALGVTPDYFKVDAHHRGATAVAAHARRRKTGSARAWTQLEARINLHRIRLHNLVRGVDLESPLTLSVLPSEEYDPAEAARMVRMQWRMPMGPVHDLIGWLEAAGAFVVMEEFETTRIDGLSQWEGLHPVFLANSRSPVDRIRWTLAHELGHLCLHPDPVDGMEAEADAFAAEFLMPEAELKPQLRRVTLSKLLPLKVHWIVSLQALIMRAYGLGCIDDQRRTSLYKQLSARGYRTREPESDKLPREVPGMLLQLVEARHASGDTLTELKQAAFIAPDNEGDASRLLPGAPFEGLRLVR